MADRYPGYDVLAKRHSPSWNEQTRKIVDERLALDPEEHSFFNDEEWVTLKAVCDRIIPLPERDKPQAPIAAMVDEKMRHRSIDGYRDARLPPQGEAWQRGLAGLDGDALSLHGRRFHELPPGEQDALLTAVQSGKGQDPVWKDLPAAAFFQKRILHDITSAYYALPLAWNQIGFGGPASPRGYVRMNYDRRDPWEASEARPGREEQARRENARVG